MGLGPKGPSRRRLSTLRLQKGLTRREIARRTRLPQSYLSALEGGLEEEVSGDVLRRLAEALGIEVDQIGYE